jgi:hypothetical protein
MNNEQNKKNAKQTQFFKKSNFYNPNLDKHLQRKMQIGHLVKTNPNEPNSWLSEKRLFYRLFCIKIMKMSVSSKKGTFLGFFAGWFSSLFGRPVTKPTAGDFRRMEFKASAQRLGIRFTEKIRQVFRFKWLRKF